MARKHLSNDSNSQNDRPNVRRVGKDTKRKKQRDLQRSAEGFRKRTGVDRNDEDFADFDESVDNLRSVAQFGGQSDHREVVIRRREVLVGPVRGQKLAHTNRDGSITVASDALRKRRGETFGAYKARVAVDLASVPEMKRRDAARVTKEIYISAVEERLRELRFYVLKPVTLGTMGQRQRARALERLQGGLVDDDGERRGNYCRIVPDGGVGPAVVFPYRYQFLPRTLDEFRQGPWFQEECHHALVKYRDANPAPPDGSVVEPQAAETAEFPFGLNSTMRGLAGWSDLDLTGLGAIAGWDTVDTAQRFVRDHWRSLAALCAELHALSLVDSAQRGQYVASRVASEVLRTRVDADAQYFLVKLLAIPFVAEFVGLWGAIPRPVAPSEPQAEFQSFQAMLGGISMPGLTPGTALHGICAISAAAYALAQRRSSDGTGSGGLASAGTFILRQLAKLPKVDTMEEAVSVLLRYMPVVLAGVSAALASGSLGPIVSGHDSTYTRFVDLNVAYNLRKQGKYDESLFKDDESFMAALVTYRDKIAPLAKQGDMSASRVWMQVCDMLATVRNDQTGRWRRAPYAFALVGESSIGKTGILHTLLAVATQQAYGSPAQPDEIYTRQMYDPYFSGYRENMKAVVYDDVANARPATGTTVPNQCWPLVEAINNSPLLLNMADLESKGKMAFNSLVVAATSNVRDLSASVYSNEPVSVLRRFDMIITPTVREEYRRSGTMMLDPTKVPPPGEVPVPDLWTFTVTEAVKVVATAGTEIVFKSLSGFPAGGDIYDLMEFLRCRCEAHFSRQDLLRDTQRSRAWLATPVADLKRAARAYAGRDAGVPAFDIGESGSAQHQSRGSGSATELDSGCDSDSDWGRESVATRSSHSSVSEFSCSDSSDLDWGLGTPVVRPGWTSLVASRLFACVTTVSCAASYASACVYRYVDTCVEDAVWARLYISLTPGVMLILTSGGVLLGCFASAFPALVLHVAVVALVVQARERARTHALRVRSVAFTAGSCTAVAALVAWAVLRRSHRAPPGGRGVERQGVAEFAVRGQVQELLRSDVPHQVSTSTFSQVCEHGEKSIYALIAAAGDNGPAGIGVLFPITTCLYVTNRHIIAPLVAGGCRSLRFVLFTKGNSQHHVLQVDVKDLHYPSDESDVVFIRMVWRKEKDLRPYIMPDAWLDRMASDGGTFPTSDARVVVLRGPDPSALSGGGSSQVSLETVSVPLVGAPTVRAVKFGEVRHTSLLMRAPTGGTRRGDCGSPVVLAGAVNAKQASYIVGIHSGVVPQAGSHWAVVAPITASMVKEAECSLWQGIAQSAPALIGQPPDLHLAPERSNPALPLPSGGYVKSLGVLQNAQGINAASLSTAKTNLNRGLFYADASRGESTPVDEILGVLAHQAPHKDQMRDVRHYVRPLLAMDAKKDGFDRVLLSMAAADYLASLRLLLGGRLPTRPFSLFEACNLTELMPALPMSTAAGFGHKGAKSRYVVRACNLSCVEPGCPCAHPSPSDYLVPMRENYFPDASIVSEVVELERRLLAGEVDLAVFRAALKDEPIAIGKDKIRAFYVGMFALNLLVRRYLMPFLSMLQVVRGYECSVGISVHSMDWEHLQEDLESYDKHKRLAGDYTSFDLSTHEVLLDEFYACLVALAADAGWSDRDIKLVKALGSNLARPVYIMLGQVFSVRGSNPSGVAVTTHTNSGVNSLLHRYAFYARNPSLVGGAVTRGGGTHFTDTVCLRTYGDDVIGAVRGGASCIPICNGDVQRAAALFGMAYGPISKGSSYFPDYYDADEVEFLKCTSVFVPELGHRVGRLALSSIRKSVAFERGTVGLSQRVSTLSSALRMYFPAAACEGGAGVGAYDRLRAIFARALADSVSGLAFEDALELLPLYDDVLESMRVGGTGLVPSADASAWDGEYQSHGVIGSRSVDWDSIARGSDPVPRGGWMEIVTITAVLVASFTLLLASACWGYGLSRKLGGDVFAAACAVYMWYNLIHALAPLYNVIVLSACVWVFALGGPAIDPAPYLV